MAAAVLCSNTVRNMLLNFASVIIYSAAPQTPLVAALSAAYKLLESGHILKVSAKGRPSIRRWDEVLTVLHYSSGTFCKDGSDISSQP